jgi:peptidase M16-like protein
MFFLIALIGGVVSQRTVASTPTIDSVTLTNGIRVVAVHFPGSTNESTFIYLPMSLTSDGPQQAQWAHLVEHLVIRSTVPADSPIANAETLPDHMRLDFYGSTNNWQEGLKHAADWLRGVPFTQQKLDAEKPKVNAECDYTVKHFATHKFALAAWAQGYRHDQSRAAMKGDVTRAALTGIQQHRDERLAVLSNTVVCLVGGLEPTTLLSAAAERLTTVKSSAKMAAPVKTHPGNREMNWDLDARHLVLTWPIPAANHADYPPLLIAAQWLNMQFFADPELKKLTGMVFAGADLTTPEGNFFFISASLRHDASFDSVREKIDQHLQQLTSGKGNRSLIPMIVKQVAESLTTLPDPAAMKGQLPPGMTMALLEMNVGLQWGMNEFRYGAQKVSLAKRLGTTGAPQVAEAARTHLAATKASTIHLGPDR